MSRRALARSLGPPGHLVSDRGRLGLRSSWSLPSTKVSGPDLEVSRPTSRPSFAAMNPDFSVDSWRETRLSLYQEIFSYPPGKSCFSRRERFTRRTNTDRPRGRTEVLSDPERASRQTPSFIVPYFELRSRLVFYARRNIGRNCRGLLQEYHPRQVWPPHAAIKHRGVNIT